MQRTTRRIGARTGVVQEALLRARNEFYRELQVQGQPPVRQVVTSLQQAIDAREKLRYAMQENERCPFKLGPGAAPEPADEVSCRARG